MIKVSVERDGKTANFEVSDEHYLYMLRLMRAKEPIAMKLWTVTDVVDVLENSCVNNGIEMTDELLASALDNLDSDVLEDCTDLDWMPIEDAVYDAVHHRGEE